MKKEIDVDHQKMIFNGFSEDTIKFFLDIRFNNNSLYFNQNKNRYKQARDEFCLLIDNLAEEVLKIDNKIDTRPHKALARIRRDTRFYKNQDPYRDHMWFIFKRPSSERFGSPFLWFELTVEKAVVGAGVWGEYKIFYDFLREKIINDQRQVRELVSDLYGYGYNPFGEKYKRIKIPSIVDASMHDIYKSKSLYFSKNIIPYSMVFSNELTSYLSSEFRKLSNYYNFCNNIIEKINSSKE